MKKSKIIVFGGDGFCGWPTSLYLSSYGHNVIIVDNFSRRLIDVELGCDSLTPLKTMAQRVATWKSLTNKKLSFKRIDVSTNYYGVRDIIKKIQPDVVIHFAEQRSAPYSMKSGAHRLYTVRNNICATHNILASIVSLGLNVHMVHLGTTGYYGYGSKEEFNIPEGYVYAELCDDAGCKMRKEIMFPADPGSIYHMTKVMDTQLFYYYNKNFKVRITDLHQGIIWGANTDETLLNDDLLNRFDYDGDYGTVLNRFIIQAVIGHPLTVYGTGEQTRAFINIKDMLKCIKIAIDNPPAIGRRVEVFNQTTEQLRLIDLAKKISYLTNAEIRYYNNPRIEARSNELKFSNKKFMSLGLDPIFVNEEELTKIFQVVHMFKDRIDRDKIICTSTWRNDIKVDYNGHKSVGVTGVEECEDNSKIAKRKTA